MNLSKLNGIASTVIACANCGLTSDRIVAKLVAKYGMTRIAAHALVNAIITACAEVEP